MTTSAPVPADSATEPVWNITYDCEDPANGLYLHPQTPVITFTTTRTDPHAAPADQRVAEQTHYVAAEDFMDVQKERDHLRRTLAFINGWRTDPALDLDRLDTVLASVGMTFAEGEAVMEIMRWARSERAAVGTDER